mmetsp:Transcript_24005/g.64944  ORF Transcript_24005/g.64944 Transcript_24005/m.64944 type:complete len:345 (-) Transcript_24005:352-1386(-)|eukprot:CAMPEP_0119487404 /NCGR_PEP_ID=MMETSP1344-20130328/13504_1 /TAXON_ID=236787 /ORGANISM="Florenciella parvula, Strain CCMP2471" /LENGTH=344 /DNA_ID=CAMNT_0007522263 /DNA_START=19 /DNA_END=1053 /DNA_ORIENTATION=+
MWRPHRDSARAVVAISARSEQSAIDFAQKHAPDAKAYGGYSSLMADSSLNGADAIYVATQPDTHAELVHGFLEHSKDNLAVLCEKPLAPNVEQVKGIYQSARERNRLVVEGMWTRCFPATVKARELIAAGKIGDVVAVNGDFGYTIANGAPAAVRGDPATGGMTLDIGIYMIEKALLSYPVSDYSMTDCQATGVLGKEDGVDLSVSSSMTFVPNAEGSTAPSGVASLFWTGLCDTQEVATIMGTKGQIVFQRPAHTPTTLTLTSQVSRTETEHETFHFDLPEEDGSHEFFYPGSIALQYEAEAVRLAVLEGAEELPHWTHAESIACHRIMGQVRQQLGVAGTSP